MQYLSKFICTALIGGNLLDNIFHLNVFKKPEVDGLKLQDQTISEFINKNGIRNDIEIILSYTSLPYAVSFNANIFKIPFIHMPIGFGYTDQHAFNFILYHELAHIKHNDRLFLASLKTITFIASMGLFYFKLPSYKLTACLTSTLVSYLTLLMHTIHLESVADNFAIEKSSDEELLGGRRFFVAIKNLNIINHENDPKAFSSDGENIANITHPSLKSRIEKIEKALKSRQIHYNTLEENAKIENLQLFILGFLINAEIYIKEKKE